MFEYYEMCAKYNYSNRHIPEIYTYTICIDKKENNSFQFLIELYTCF